MIARRALLVFLIVACGGLLAWNLSQNGPASSWLPGCLFHEVTGLHCPGCGMTRAAHACLHGDLAAGFRFNVLGMIVLPVALAVGGYHLLFWMLGKKAKPLFPPSWNVGWWVLGLIVVFAIIRNFPTWPFTLLAPH